MRVPLSLIFTSIVGLSGAVMPGRAIAAFSVTPTADPQALRTALFGDIPRIASGSSSLPPPISIIQFNLGGPNNITNAYAQFNAGSFQDLGLSRGLVMSTGTPTNLAGPNCADGVNPYRLALATCRDRLLPNTPAPNADLNSDFRTPSLNPPDQVVLDIIFEASQPGSLNFKYVFGSEEFPEFVPPPNRPSDRFRVLLADVNDPRQPILRGENQITVSTAAFKSNRIGAPNSLTTALDGYTNPIQVRLPFQTGRNRLVFSIEDIGLNRDGTNDDSYDSVALIEQISVETTAPPSIPTPSLLFGVVWMSYLRWRDRRQSL
jgi:hypothetical protein